MLEPRAAIGFELVASVWRRSAECRAEITLDSSTAVRGGASAPQGIVLSLLRAGDERG
jgi:hypothetical protein